MNRNHTVEFLLAGVAGCGACLFTNPLEVVKIRMQLQGELKARGQSTIVYRNAIHGLYTIAKSEGIAGIQKGLVPGLWYQMTMNGLRLGTFQILTNAGYTTSSAGEYSFTRTIVASAVAGAFATWVGSPFYLVKTHLQSRAVKDIAVGYQHSYKSMTQGLVSIYRSAGIPGMWRGAYASVIKVMVGSAVQLTTFSFVKQYVVGMKYFHPDDGRNALLATVASAVTNTLCMTPFDVVATRMYNQGVSSKGKGLTYAGFSNCFIQIFRTEGFWGFYKGWGPQFLRLGPQTVLSLFFWDRLRYMYKLSFL
ncbi:solute carrier family 25 member 35-like [Ostrea edulis]|uniref:solute carrier family 25 member 35-like n=1 Tax=Ostrea edulis TaxID=37623 RepID=UPI002094B93C|nr:solute carrier family 25 member 35-like [Ostrea edulis]